MIIEKWDSQRKCTSQTTENYILYTFFSIKFVENKGRSVKELSKIGVLKKIKLVNGKIQRNLVMYTFLENWFSWNLENKGFCKVWKRCYQNE